ncbi:MAG: 6-phosphogluconolactonase [Firmicutes bacterium]|nr:6-phosphogluconolactonase [Alicyclobacillaceae bacterium]MCL6496563.1 6-phosphogluconolactonase [Bacillota bacterium]
MTEAGPSRWHIAPDVDTLVAELGEWLRQEAEAAIAARGRFRWAVPGGSTPRRLYAWLARPDQQSAWSWEQVELFVGDERDVLPTHPDSNYGMIARTLLQHLVPPPARVTRFVTEGGPAVALAQYRAALARCPRDPDGWPILDLVLLGLGQDGHCASLFPQAPALASSDWVAGYWVDDRHGFRYTLTLSVLCRARTVAFLVTGQDKAAAVAQVLAAPSDSSLPAARLEACRAVLSPASPVVWFLDRPAAQALPSTGPAL